MDTYYSYELTSFALNTCITLYAYNELQCLLLYSLSKDYNYDPPFHLHFMYE